MRPIDRGAGRQRARAGARAKALRRRRATALLLFSLALAVVAGALLFPHIGGSRTKRLVPAPTTIALGKVKAWRGERATIHFRVSDPARKSASATVVIRSGAGAIAKTIAIGSVRTNRRLSFRFLATIPAGTYSYRVLARSGDGAPPGPATPATLVVRQAFPGPAAIAAATRWLRSRTGVTALAVVDTSGRLHGYDADEQFVTASVVKAMLLVAYLRTYSSLSSEATATLTNMIEVSDNNAAFELYRLLGSSGMYAVAHAAAMRHFWVARDWTYAEITAADQARFFYEMDHLIPARYDTFARDLLSHVAAYESWGIPTMARPAGWTVFFKGGWRGTERGQLVHQVARLERPGEKFSIAVMTDGDPDMDYGIATIQGVAARLLGISAPGTPAATEDGP